MERLRIALVVVENNDFQRMQVAAARTTAERLAVDLCVLPIEYDAVMQSQKILTEIQGPASTRPHGVIFEPVGTTLAQPAAVAASLGIAWAVLGREKVEYISELRRQYRTPIFSVSSSHYDIGRMQGEQLSRLIPNGGSVLYIGGPSTNEAAIQRTAGAQATKAKNITMRAVKGLWTEASGYNAVASFLRVRSAPITAIAAQNDAMALGAYRGFEELTYGEYKKRYLSLPFLGCDGIPSVGEAAVCRGQLAATVVIPPSAAIALEAMVLALRDGVQPADKIVAKVASYPSLKALKPSTSVFSHSVAPLDQLTPGYSTVF